MRKIKPGTLTAGTVENDFKGTIGRFVESGNAFPIISSVIGAPAYQEQFLHDVLAVASNQEYTHTF